MPNVIKQAADPIDTRRTAEAFLELLGRGDPDRIADVFAESIDWNVPGDPDLPWTGRRAHASDVSAFFKVMSAAFIPGRSAYTVDRIVVEGGDAVIVGAATHTFARSGRQFTTPMLLHVTIDDAKIVRLRLYEDTYLVARSSRPDAGSSPS
jgi:ketosteroid isomerase-like protein